MVSPSYSLQPGHLSGLHAARVRAAHGLPVQRIQRVARGADGRHHAVHVARGGEVVRPRVAQRYLPRGERGGGGESANLAERGRPTGHWAHAQAQAQAGAGPASQGGACRR